MFKSLTVATAVVAVLLVAGCTSDDDGPKTSGGPTGTKSSTPSVAESKAAAAATSDLNAAVQELARTSYKFTMKAGDASSTGTVDPAIKQSSVTVTVVEFKTEVLIVDPELYARITGLGLPGVDESKWLKIDRSKIKSFAALGIHDLNDPTGVNTLAKTIATIQKTGDRSYKGTLDLSKGSDAFGLDAAAIRSLAEKAKAIPFEATVTQANKLATWKMTIPAYGAEKETTFDLAYTEHGGNFPVTKPPANQVANPPQTVYDMLQA
jgi:outer membrane murein-binding lipoprotein Lpp